MIKRKLFIGIVSVFILGSCSNDDFVVDDSKVSNIQEIGSSGVFPLSFYESLIHENPDLYDFEESNSHLWVDEESGLNLRAANTTYTVTGYDEIKMVADQVFRCPNGVLWDSRVKPYGGTNLFIGNIRLYVKYVRIPKGATLVIPPKSVLDKLPCIGRYPVGANFSSVESGYNHKFKSSTTTEDIYELITEAVATTYNGEGRELFRPPFYIPEKAKDGPASFQFKYQYTYAEWD